MKEFKVKMDEMDLEIKKFEIWVEVFMKKLYDSYIEIWELK